MGCNNLGLIAKVTSKLTKQIVKGSSVDLSITVSGSGCPVKLNDFVGATGYFVKEDETALIVVGSLISEDLGQIGFSMTPSQSSELQLNDYASFQVDTQWGGKEISFIIEEALQIKDPIF
jgi:hypothetical protein